MSHQAEFRRCLEDCDVSAMRRLHAHVMAHLPAPKTVREALASIHMARTQSGFIGEDERFYSHRWLLDHDLPSMLPDALKPRAERMYPKVVEAVGISVNAKSEMLKPIMPRVRAAMSAAVEDAFAENRRDPVFVKAQMMLAYDKTKRFFRDLFEESIARQERR